MCLITNDKTKYIAKEDITVYKMLAFTHDEKYCGRSFHHGNHYYMLGEQPEVEMKESNQWVAYDSVAMVFSETIYPQFRHSYFGEDITQEQRDIFMCIGAGYHSMVKGRIDWTIDLIVVKCIIPEGAEYYKDITGLYVSNRLVVVEKEQRPESEN